MLDLYITFSLISFGKCIEPIPSSCYGILIDLTWHFASSLVIYKKKLPQKKADVMPATKRWSEVQITLAFMQVSSFVKEIPFYGLGQKSFDL